MAHFARIENGVVVSVVVVSNDAIGGGGYPDSEALGQALLAESGIDGDWRQCSYSGSFRGAYPGIGWAYDEVDGFAPRVPPAPSPDDEITVTAQELTDAGLDAKAIESLSK